MEKKVLLIMIIFTSCTSQNEEIFKFDPRSGENNYISLGQICDDIFYIPLENDIQLGLFNDNIKYINKSFFFSALDVGILEFDRNGRLIRKIGSIGRGPGEYTYYEDFTIDDKNKTIYVRDRSGVIKVYSESGKFLKNITFLEDGGSIETIRVFNSKLFVFKYLQFGESRYNWIIYDTLGNLIKLKDREIPFFRSGWGGGCGTYDFENRLFYWNIYSDTVFSILPDLNYKASFIISPGEHRLPSSSIEPSMLSQYMHIWQIFETERFYSILYTYKKPKFALIDKKTRESFLSNLEIYKSNTGSSFIGGLLNDLDGGIAFLPQSYFQEKGQEFMLALLNPYQIKYHVSSNEFIKSTPSYPEKKKELEKLANSLKETDNPVLMIVKLKK